MPGRVLDVRAAVVDVHVDPRVLVRVVRVELPTQGLDLGIDLYGVDALRPLRQRDRDVVPGAGADDQHIV